MKISPLFFLSLFLFSIISQAQTLPNPSFEDWVIAGTACENPQSWDTPNSGLSLFSVCSVFKEESLVNTGSASVKMVTTLVPLINLRAPAAISNGTLVVNASDPFNSIVRGGTPIWGRPDALIGFFRYQPEGGDSLTIRVRLFSISGADTTLIAEDEFFSFGATTGFESFNLPINYLSSEDADLAQVLARSTRNTKDATVGTTLWLDDLRFTGISGLGQQGNMPFAFTLYPNPATDYLVLDNAYTSEAHWELLSVSGSVALRGVLTPGQQSIDLSGLFQGLYVFRALDSRSGKLLQSSKIQILR